jgi:hypothetical protein
MIFTEPNIASLSKALWWWELGEYVACGLVAVGCAGEYIGEFTNRLTGGDEERKHHLRKGSTLLLVSALALELLCLVQTNIISGRLTGSLAQEAEEADTKAKTALTDSATALTQSHAAEDSSKRALGESDTAAASASSAQSLASGARREADSFEKDIVSAKTQATAAESHLAEALKRADDASVEVNRVKSPRSLNNAAELVSALQPYKDTEYTFSAVYAEEESITLLKAIDKVLQDAGWKRIKPPSGYPSINVYGPNVDFVVPAALTSGITVSVGSSDSLAVLQSLPLAQLPQNVRAAIALNLSLGANISPAQEPSQGLVDVQPNTPTTIRIAVGKKR